MRVFLLLLVMLQVSPVPTIARTLPLSHLNKDVEREVWHLLLARAVANQPKAVGWAKYFSSMKVKPNSPDGKRLFGNIRKYTQMPTLSVEGDALVMKTESADPLKIELVSLKERKLLINGREIQLNPTLPIGVQLETLIASPKQARAFSFSLIESAYAANDKEGSYLGSVPMLVPTAYGAVGSAFGAGLVFVFSGFFHATTLVPTAIGATVGLGACGVVSVPSSTRFSGPKDSFGERFANCVAMPLSLLDVNPRDRFYPSAVQCDKAFRTLDVMSPSGISQRRSFLLDDQGRLAKIEVSNYQNNHHFTVSYSVDASSAPAYLIDSGAVVKMLGDKEIMRKNISNPKNDTARTLIADFEYASHLCQDKSKLLKTRQEIQDEGIANERRGSIPQPSNAAE